MGLPGIFLGLGPNIDLTHHKAWAKPGFLISIYTVLPSVVKTMDLVGLQFEHLFPHVGPGPGGCLLFSEASPLCVLRESAR